MIDNEKILGKVDSVDIVNDPVLQFCICFKLDSYGHQCFTDYSLDTFDKKKDRRVGTAFGLDCILKIFDVFNVTSLKDIVDKTCWLYRSDELNPIIIGIEGHSFDGGNKLIIKDLVNEWKKEKESS